MRYTDPLNGILMSDGEPKFLSIVSQCCSSTPDRRHFIWDADKEGGSEKTEDESMAKADQALVSQGWILG